MTNVKTPTLPPLTFQHIVPSLIATSRKQAIRLIAKEAAKLTGVSEKILTERMTEPSKDHSSIIGDGAEISHLRVSGLSEPINIFINFKNPIPFNAADNKDVELFCLIITPNRDNSVYLRTLSRVSRLLRNKQMRKELMGAKDEKTIRAILDQSQIELIAA